MFYNTYMVAQKQTPQRAGGAKKQHGLHHRKTKQYAKIYWPYMPILIVVAMGLLVANMLPHLRGNVLAYATDVASTSLLDATNRQRQANGTNVLQANQKLAAAAQAKANDMAARNYWSHTTPDGKEPWYFVQAAGYAYLKAGENLAYGFTTSSDVVGGWMNSPSHRANLLDSAYTEVGFGMANADNFNKAGKQTIVVAMYGQPSTALVPELTPNSNGTTAVNSAAVGQPEPGTTTVALIQSITQGNAPWALFGMGIAAGTLFAFLLIKHGLAVRRLVLEGEAFVVHHPKLDIVLVGLIMLAYILSRNVGFIK